MMYYIIAEEYGRTYINDMSQDDIIEWAEESWGDGANASRAPVPRNRN